MITGQTRNADEREGEQRTDESVERCPECDATCSATAEEELVCEECGLVLDERRLDRGPEWRAFTQGERESRSRVGSPTSEAMHDKGLTTYIHWKNEDANGRAISAERRGQMERLRTWQERIRVQESGERNLQHALSEIDRMSSALGVPRSVREVASVIYRRALDEDLIRGRSIEGTATATLYAACRREGIPRSLEEVEEVSRVDQREIARTYRYVARELGLDLEPVTPEQFVPRFASELGLSDEAEAMARRVLERTMEQGLHSGKSPTGFAAAAIYTATLLCNDRRTQAEIADVAQVTDVTIRNRYQEQVEAMNGLSVA